MRVVNPPEFTIECRQYLGGDLSNDQGRHPVPLWRDSIRGSSSSFPAKHCSQRSPRTRKPFYTAGRLASARRRLEDFYKKRGYFTVNVEASGDPAAARDGKVRVVFQIEPGPIYRFDGVTVSGDSGGQSHRSSKSVSVDCRGKVYRSRAD